MTTCLQPLVLLLNNSIAVPIYEGSLSTFFGSLLIPGLSNGAIGWFETFSPLGRIQALTEGGQNGVLVDDGGLKLGLCQSGCMPQISTF